MEGSVAQKPEYVGTGRQFSDIYGLKKAGDQEPIIKTPEDDPEQTIVKDAAAKYVGAGIDRFVIIREQFGEDQA